MTNAFKGIEKWNNSRKQQLSFQKDCICIRYQAWTSQI